MRIAIAGGTSPTLGDSIVSALLATDGRYTPVVLSRAGGKPPLYDELSQEKVEIKHVDYHSQPSLVAALQGIDTVISVVLVPGPEWVTSQINLLRAAEEAGCRRFAPSEFALTFEAQEMVDILHAKNSVWKEVQSSVKIDTARFPCGMFMNYLGIGCPDRASLAGFKEGPFLVHLDEDPPWIEVPVRTNGSFPSITMTELSDIGRFIVAALDIQEPWGGRDLGMAGDTIDFTKLTDLCETYVGKKLQVKPVTGLELQARLRNLSPDQFMERMNWQLAIVCGIDKGTVSPTLNSLCSFKPTSVEDYLRRYWASNH